MPPPKPASLDRRVTMLMFDGASLDFMTPDVAAGRLPNIGRIFDQGAVLHLATLRPTQAEPVWSAIATGRNPIDNGIRSAAKYRAFGGTPISPAARLLFLAGARHVRISHRGGADRQEPVGPSDLGHPQRSGHARGRDWLAA